MRFNILTIFPEFFDVLDYGVIGKAKDKGLFSTHLYDVKDHPINKHGQIDAKPYGGGEGMVIMPEPLKNSLNEIPKKKLGKVIYLSPQGAPLNNIKAKDLSEEDSLTFICGRYDDKKIIEKFINLVDLVTFEFENIPFNVLKKINQEKAVLPKPEINKLIQNRLTEKDFLNKYNIQTTKYALIKDAEDIKLNQNLIPEK